jgi:hemerythrin-like domain-containing protein
MTPTRETPLEKPIQDFSDCHAGIVNALKDLRILSSQQVESRQRRDLAGRTLKFFREVVTTHHTEEETDLFPAVLADATVPEERKQVEALVTQLVREHRRVEGLYARLAPTLLAMERGSDVSLDAALVVELVEGYLAHARFEETVFLPLAQSILGRNSNHMAALGLSMHIRHASSEVRRQFGFL